MNKQKQNQAKTHESNISTNPGKNTKNRPPTDQPDTKHNNRPQWSAYSMALNIGFMIVIPILAFGIGGVLLDRYLDTFPVFVLVGFFLAMTSGLLIVYKKSKDIIENLSSQNFQKSKTQNCKKEPAEANQNHKY